MCDPVTLGLMIASTVATTAQASSQAKQTAALAGQQAFAEAEAANRELALFQKEQNRLIAEEQAREIEEQSDLQRVANEKIGELRAAEFALSNNSLGSLFFEEYYNIGKDQTRISQNVSDRISAIEAGKASAQQSTINRQQLAFNQAVNISTQAAQQAQAQTFSSISSLGGGLGAERTRVRNEKAQLKLVKGLVVS